MNYQKILLLFVWIYCTCSLHGQVFQSKEFSSIVLWSPDHLEVSSREMIEFSIEEVIFLENKLQLRIQELNKEKQVITDEAYAALVQNKMSDILQELDDLQNFKENWMDEMSTFLLLDTMISLIETKKCFLVRTDSRVCSSDDVIVVTEKLDIEDDIFIKIPMRKVQRKTEKVKKRYKNCKSENPEDCIVMVDVPVLESFKMKSFTGGFIDRASCPVDFVPDESMNNCVLTIPKASWGDFSSTSFMNCDYEYEVPREVVVISCEE